MCEDADTWTADRDDDGLPGRSAGAGRLTAFLGSSPGLALEGSTLDLGDQTSGMTLEEQ